MTHYRTRGKRIGSERQPLSVYISISLKLIAFAAAIGLGLRIAFAFHPLTEASSLSVGQWLGVFGLGIVNDILVTTVMLMPIWALMLCSGHWRFRRPQCWIFLAVMAGLWAWITWGCRALHEFNGPLSRVLSWVMVFWIATYALRAFVPRLRAGWMRAAMSIMLFAYLSILVLNLFGEWLFWDEFGVRYNFIAVDYLVYTTEVIGNIMQSYSMGWILSAVVMLAIAVEWLMFDKDIKHSSALSRPKWRPAACLYSILALAISAIFLPLTYKSQQSGNVWYNELQANGVYSFVNAFFKNQLSYSDFYITAPPYVQSELKLSNQMELADSASVDTLDIQNIVLITMESMSGDYMRRFGNDFEMPLTPVLDSLYAQSIAFNNMFAAGNRTVRGLEAVTLSRPPSPGESIIKRPEETVYPSIAPTLQKAGFKCAFYYGGDSYFDNMGPFFSRLGYEIKDGTTMLPSEISCRTIWGICDGDVYTRLLHDLDSANAKGESVYAHLLTTSNHRPYIYPEGCISIPAEKKSKKGAVMYSDYALGHFMSEAAQRPWHSRTAYVIVADHCASSAGSTELPLHNYHIPALIYLPGSGIAREINETVSQVDLMPTLFSLMGLHPDSALYGCNVLSGSYKPRAFVATYQDMGLLVGDTLTVLSPGRKARQFKIAPNSGYEYEMEPIEDLDSAAIYRAAAIYQSAN